MLPPDHFLRAEAGGQDPAFPHFLRSLAMIRRPDGLFCQRQEAGNAISTAGLSPAVRLSQTVSAAAGERTSAAIFSSFRVRSAVHSNEKLSAMKFLNEAAGENIGPGARLIFSSKASREAATASKL